MTAQTEPAVLSAGDAPLLTREDLTAYFVRRSLERNSAPGWSRKKLERLMQSVSVNELRRQYDIHQANDAAYHGDIDGDFGY